MWISLWRHSIHRLKDNCNRHETFISVKDAGNLQESIGEALKIKRDVNAYSQLGKGKTLGLLFLNPSLRTRMSTQRAAYNLGMNVIVVNLDKIAGKLNLKMAP